MKQKLLCFFMLGILLIGSAYAQDRRISGRVTAAADGSPISGVSVFAVGTNVAAQTDEQGAFTVNVPEAVTALEFRYLGYTTQRVDIGNQSVINVELIDDAASLDEVVVTAMGISRSEKTLGYSATKVGGEEIARARNSNITNSLAGKVAGLQIQSSASDPGSANSVVIRGFGSINGSNQPLYVVDGVPLQSSTFQTSGHSLTVSGVGNIASDDIESMTVLKGAAATALYGSRASNGVIVITTKQGRKGAERNYTIDYNGGMQLRQVSYFPEMQNSFGQGWNGTQTFIENGSWGPRLDGSMQVYGPIWNHQQLIHEYSARENNVKDFFDLGISNNHNVSLSGTSDDSKTTYFLSYSNASDDGIMPTKADSYERNTIAYRGTYQGADWFKVSSSVNFATAKTNTVGSFQGTSVVDGLYEMPRDVSIVDMKDLSSPFNTPEAYFTPYGITNPYWSLANNYNQLNSKQLYGKVQADVNPIKELTLTYRFGYDYNDYDIKVGTPEIKLDDALINEDYGYAPSNMNQTGNVYARYGRSYEFNHDFLATYDNRFEQFSLTAVAGLNINERSSTYMLGQTDGLSFFTGFWDLSNGATRSDLSEAQSKRRLVGLFGDVTLGYEEMLFLNLTARNDWSSTLPIDKNSYFYPGATLSWLFTEVMPKNDILSFGKLRLAYGRTGADASPYRTSNIYVQGFANGYYGNDIAAFPMNGINAFLLSGTAGSLTLRPEMTSEFEAGLNLQFLRNRIGLDAAFYNRITSDQIFTLPVDPSTGFTNVVTNFGEVRNRGIELLLNTTPVRTEKFRWDLDVNFAINYNKVLSMPESLEGGKVNIYSFSAGNDAVYMYAEEGRPMGQYYTYLPKYVTDRNSDYYGYQVVDNLGQPVIGTDVEDAGLNMNHKWIGGATTSLSAYGFTLSAALDVRYGGGMFSRTKNLMQFTGNGVVTLYNDRKPFIVPNSVQMSDDGEGNITYTENTTPLKLSNQSYQNYFNNYGWGNGGKAYLIDRSYAKLRNISLAYDLPSEWIKSTHLSKISVSAFVNNAFIWTASDNHYIDPEGSTVGADLSGQFGELYVNPASRIYGFNVNVRF
ncbi:SusC/RagA family TonB-linked outer membrane protein [Parapedobacter pyrenivorans]|uniref:SusC/RagA family TonB-linked outer membrane protein n=1 Tax=Parapedobacter pyrenivorans TaxID=1305674 RepID=UPI00333E30A2